MEIVVRKPTEDEIAKAKTWPVWEKEPSVFPYEYDSTETCLILEGKAKVKAGNKMVSFGPGDWVIFPTGLKCTWTIEKQIRKHYKFD
jgi:hypothetical protein